MRDEKVALCPAPGTGIEDLVHAAALGYAGDGVHHGRDQGSGGRHVAAVAAGVRHLGGRGSKSELPSAAANDEIYDLSRFNSH